MHEGRMKRFLYFKSQKFKCTMIELFDEVYRIVFNFQILRR